MMPLTEKGEKIKGAMSKQYGPEKGEQVFYASKNKGTIKGVDKADAESEPGEKEKAREEQEQESLDLPTQLKDAEQQLEALEREQEQVDEGQERQNAIDDTKEQIRSLRDEIRSQTRKALGKADALAELEAKQDSDLIVKHIEDAVDGLSKRMDAFEEKNKKDYAGAVAR
jgi:hypothetical protein